MTATDRPLRIATRRSMLATRQSRLVADALRGAHAGLAVELVEFTTRGDRQAGPLAPVGGKGLFTAELETALRDGRVDLAVHSAKDMPAEMGEDMAIAAVPPREDPRDALVSPGGVGPDALASRATVGTGSPRRRAQLLRLRGDLQVVGLRGNVDTRVKKAIGRENARDALDAAVLAMAGLRRSALAGRYAGQIHPLQIDEMIPAAGQGTLVVQASAGRDDVLALCAPLDDATSRDALIAERSVVRALGADCHSCLAVHLSGGPDAWRGLALAARPDGGGMMRISSSGATGEETAGDLLERLRSNGAERLLTGLT